METCYKLIRSDIAKKINIRENRFGIEPEITARASVFDQWWCDRLANVLDRMNRGGGDAVVQHGHQLAKKRESR